MDGFRFPRIDSLEQECGKSPILFVTSRCQNVLYFFLSPAAGTLWVRLQRTCLRRPAARGLKGANFFEQTGAHSRV